LSITRLSALFDTKDAPSASEINKALEELSDDLASRGIELKEVASGYRLQTRNELMPWISRLSEERPQRYSRALLETLALIAYRQPITRGEIEEVRGVSVSSNIVRTLQEREWIRVVGHRDVPGKPALFGTTKAFLDYFNLISLDDLPTLAEIRDMANLEPELDFETGQSANDSDGEQLTESGDNESTPAVDSDSEGTSPDHEADANPADMDIDSDSEISNQSDIAGAAIDSDDDDDVGFDEELDDDDDDFNQDKDEYRDEEEEGDEDTRADSNLNADRDDEKPL
jgi:segregation and condensation protein B